MPKPKPRMAVQAGRAPQGAATVLDSGTPAQPQAAEVLAGTRTAPWVIGFGVLTVLAIVLLWLPLGRIGAHYEFNYNEGWNAYAQNAASHGQRIYGQAPVLTYFNYPPLSFHIVGLFGRLVGDMTAAGRWISVAAFFGLVILTGLSVERLTGSRLCAAFSALTLAIFIAALKAERIGMNDPHLLAMLFAAFGFYAYVRDPESSRWLRISAVAFAVALFTKQSMVVFPGAVAIQLLLTSKRRFLMWAGTAAAGCVVLLILTFAVDGSHFLEHLGLGRVYSYAVFLSNAVWYVMFFQVAIALALVWCFWNGVSNRRSVLLWAFVLANVVGLWFSAGEGADLNHVFDALVALAMIGGVVLPYGVPLAERVRYPSTLLGVLLCVPFFLGIFAMLPSHIQEDMATHAAVPQLEQDYANAVQFVRSRPGPALCESLLLCYDAGKPEEYDPFAADQLVKTGKLPQAAILRLLDVHHFATIQIVTPANEPLTAAARLRLSAPFMTTLLNDYQLAMRTNSYAIFTPKP